MIKEIIPMINITIITPTHTPALNIPPIISQPGKIIIAIKTMIYKAAFGIDFILFCIIVGTISYY